MATAIVQSLIFGTGIVIGIFARDWWADLKDWRKPRHPKE